MNAMNKAVGCAGAVLALLSPAWAQEKERREIFIQHGPGPGPGAVFEREIAGPEGALGDLTFEFMGGGVMFAGKTVKGSPYAADAITEITQMLPDGNRIVNKSTASVARDSEGRTRWFRTLSAIGPFAPAGGAPAIVTIDDPVAGVHYILNGRKKTATKVPLPTVREGERQVRTFTMRAPEPGAAGVAAIQKDVLIARRPLSGDAKSEPLGKQIIEGVEAEGTRRTITIPAGAVGNERPIDIVSEEWHSPRLQTVVLSRRSDPRTGETVYRLTNINTSEPSPMLFQVPPDYTVEEPRIQNRRTEKRL